MRNRARLGEGFGNRLQSGRWDPITNVLDLLQDPEGHRAVEEVLPRADGEFVSEVTRRNFSRRCGGVRSRRGRWRLGGGRRGGLRWRLSVDRQRGHRSLKNESPIRIVVVMTTTNGPRAKAE